MHQNRIICSYEGSKKGPLLICLGGIHGNELAGVRAIDLVGKMLEVEPITNPDFHYHGKFLGIRGNLQALQAGKRFIDKDLNRSFTAENIAKVRQRDITTFEAEDFEIMELMDLVFREIEAYQPEELYMMDLHTTTATGGIFCITKDEDPKSVRLAVDLRAPVIKGIAKGIRGTTIEFFTSEYLSVPTTCVVFEAGQHEEPLSINRSIAAIINCMSSVGAVRAQDVENQHNHLLIEYSRNLPKVAELIKWHHVVPEDEFKMLPNFQNFQLVKKGELLAHDRNGPIHADVNGMLLMPKYQEQGNDGFFIVTEIMDY
jgi:succinylglutamate desuccinylase